MEGLLRKILPLYLFTMLGLLYWLLSSGTLDNVYWVMLAVAAVICLLTFINFVHVFNFGYASSVIVLNLILTIYFEGNWLLWLVTGLMVLYGLRLFAFSWQRKSAQSYRHNQAANNTAHQQMPLFVKILLWIFTTLLYVFYSFPVYLLASYGPQGKAHSEALTVFAAVVMAVGLVMETLADSQKQAFKANSQSFCDIGLFSSCRHPNYLGEIIFVTGIFLVGINYAQTWYEWLATTLAPSYLWILMWESAKRGDRTQQQKYGDDPAYQTYAKNVPSLIPRWHR